MLAGFGAPCVIATVFFPFHIGAALVNMLFPVFVLVACGCDPVAAQGESAGCLLGHSLWMCCWAQLIGCADDARPIDVTQLSAQHFLELVVSNVLMHSHCSG